MQNLQERERKRLHMDMIHVKTAIHKKMNKIEITDLALPELQVYTSLNEAQLLHYYEPAPGIFIAESPKVIERALEFGCEPISLLMEQKDFDTREKISLQNAKIYRFTQQKLRC